MLDFFRQKGLTSAIYGIIIVGMILVFVLGFNPTAGKKLGSVNTECTARVRGGCIEPKAHRAAYRLIFARGTPGLRQEMASRMVLDGLIERELLAAEADRLGLTVGEDEITDSIFRGNIYASLPSENPNMGRQLGFDNGHVVADQLVPNGFKNKDSKQFDMKIYERTIKQLTGRSPAEFREWQARELLAAKMRDLVRAPVRVADDEAFDRYVTERTTSMVNFLMVRKSWVEKYAIASDQSAVDAWAKANASKIVVPVRHILIKAGEKPEEKEAAKKKAEGVLERVKKGEDFAKLAKEFSDDPGSKDKGGQYPGEMVSNFVEPFKKSVEGLKPGELDQKLVETNFGYHIIKRDEATKDDIAKAFKASKSTDVAKEIAKDISADLKAGKSGDDAIKAAIGKWAKFAPKTEKPKDEKKDDKKADAKGDASAATASGDAGAGDAAATPAAPVYTAYDDPERPQFLKSSAFNRGGDPIPAISGEAAEAVTKFAFDAKPNDVVAEPIMTDDGYLVVQLQERKPATKEEFDKERDVYVQGLLAAKQGEALAYYARRLRDSYKQDIKIDEKNLFGAKSDAGPSKPDDDEE